MTRNGLLVRLHGALRRFARTDDGNVLATFAIALIPMLGATGVAIDYSRASAAQTAMQAAADATALMISKNATSDTASTVQTSATNIFNSLFSRPDTRNVQVTGTYTSDKGSTVVVGATAAYQTMFMGILGFKRVPLAVSATTSFGNSRLRVALVLDNTGSMADSGKISALKTATNNLLTQLKNAATTNGDVYVSIIPFVKDVNMDASNYVASWIDWTDWDEANGSCSKNASTASSCAQKNGTWTPANHNTWNGCVVDRGDSTQPNSANYDTNITAPTTTITATLWAAEQYASCPHAALGLSYDWSGMTTLVNNMTPNGTTNQAIGLAAGWMSLVGGGPFTAPAMDPNYTYQQVIILLTDGLNTQDRWYTSQNSIDARESMTCANIKAAGVVLYTIQVDTDGSPTSTLLRDCATDSTKFFLLKSANEIVTTFSTIATNLSKLRIAK